ncbi:CBS domain-containing protein [uncultured Aquitalea sp.]|uniref:CBS domain-containing protein n=1 Tax=uncultured Aquitalea sp. TaxID=540272 RepID=UPI0025D70C8C|nr:CBS domain-containing protein [uncultured Aquitalea sp.]
MENTFQPLPSMPMPKHTDLIHLDQRPLRPINLSSPALEVMTDLRVVDPVSIDQDEPLRVAHNLMVSRGIRLLFVQDDESRLVGIITASDILGERPVQRMQEHGKRHHDVLVRDVMSTRTELEMLSYADVSHATVGHMVATLKKMGRQHALVAELDVSSGHYQLCGLFSTSHMARRLGMPLNFIRVPQALSEIQHALLHEG